MRIETVDRPEPLGTEHAAADASAPPSTGDSTWFRAQLLDPAPAVQNTESSATRLVGQLSSHSSELKRLADHAGRDLQKASRTASPQDMLSATRAQSKYYLETLLTAKVVNKVSPALEKVTTLQ